MPAVWRRRGIEGLAAHLAASRPPLTARDEYSSWIAAHDRLTDEDRTIIRARIARLTNRPLISVVMPVHDPAVEHLRRAVESVRDQIYPHWELCVADDASATRAVHELLEHYARADARIKVATRTERGHISLASNTALELASGTFVALLDHDDELADHALSLVAEALDDASIDLIYTDHDKIDARGRRERPYFKPSWNPDLFHAQNFLNHLVVYRTSLVREVGGFRRGFEGSQDYDLALRVIERTPPERIRHIPHVLYHWRASSTSTAASLDIKPYAVNAARAALQSHFSRQDLDVTVTDAPLPGFHRIRYPLATERPLVSLIVTTRQAAEMDRHTWLDDFLARTGYAPIEVTVADLRSPPADAETLNLAVERCRGELILLLREGLEVRSPGWLSEMAGHALRAPVGAVGAKLCDADGRIAHAGFILGSSGIAASAHAGLRCRAPGPFGRACLVADVSALSSACLMMRRRVFQEVAGFDTAHVPTVHYLDYAARVDERRGHEALEAAHRLRDRGYRIHFHVFEPEHVGRIIDWFSVNVRRVEILEGPCQPETGEEFHFLLKRP